jgi:hypothetical protein
VHCRTWLVTCGLVAVSLIPGAATLAQDASTPAPAEDAPLQRPADIRLGTCASLGQVVAPLSALTVPSGEKQGQTDATPVEQSVTEVPVLLSGLLASSHVVLIQKSTDEAGTPVACGEIGGALSDEGDLAVALNPVEGSKLSGVAYFAPKRSDDGTTVTLLVVDERGTRRGGETSGPVGMAGEDGTITIGGDTTTGAANVNGSTDSTDTTAGDRGNRDGQGGGKHDDTADAPTDGSASDNNGGSQTSTAADDGKGNRGGRGGGRAGQDGTANG